MTAFPEPPEWLNAWEAESGLAHPEARPTAEFTDCPQCAHARHYGRCMRAVDEQRCECGPAA